MIAYFDTSAVVPLLVEEPGTDISLRVLLQTTVALAGDRDLLAAWQREGLQVLDTQS